MTDPEVLENDKEVLKNSYYELINMKSRCGGYPTKDKWIKWIDEDRVDGSFTQGYSGEWYLNDIQIKDINYPGRNVYSFIRTRLPI